VRRQPSLRAARLLGAGTLGVAILATGASAVAQATDTTNRDATIELKLADRQLRLGQQVVASGTVRDAAAGTPVTLEFRPRSGGPWSAVGSATTTAGGSFRLAGAVDRSGRVRVVPGGGARAVAASTSATGGASPEQRVDVHAKVLSSLAHTDVLRGRTAQVRGMLKPGGAGRTVVLQARRGGRWRALDRDRTDGHGAYALRYRAARTGAWPLRVLFRGDAAHARAYHAVGRLQVYRPAAASWYGPGLYGGHLACGGTLTPGTLGVANRSLPCGARVTLRYHGRSVRVPVVDRGPYAGNREFDLTAATKARLGFGSTGTVWTTR
jgi:rare lipoprotein A